MTGSILTPFTLVAIVIILGCVLAALYFLARRRTPSAKPAPRDGKASAASPRPAAARRPSLTRAGTGDRTTDPGARC